MLDHDSKISCHVHENNHKMNFVNVKVVGHKPNFHESHFFEARFSIKDPQCGNDPQFRNDVWLSTSSRMLKMFFIPSSMGSKEKSLAF